MWKIDPYKVNVLFTKNKIIHKYQFAFRKGKSTEHAILDIYGHILKALEKKDKAYRIFLNFAKAFGTVNHKTLLIKFEYYGVRGILLILLLQLQLKPFY